MVAALVLSHSLMTSAAWVLVALAMSWIGIGVHVASAIDAAIVARRPRRAVRSMGRTPFMLRLLLILAAAAVWVSLSKITTSGLQRAGVHYQPITTQAMRPAIQPGDNVVAYRTSSLKRWDVVVFHPPGRQDLFTRRVVGLPGEKVEIFGNQLRINDVPIALPPGVGPYASHVPYGPQNGCEGHPITLGPAEYFVLCDNADSVDDSRVFPDSVPGHGPGAIPLEAIVGRVTAIAWPPYRIRRLGE